MTRSYNPVHKRTRTGLTADSSTGRALLALRAGMMSATEMTERFPTSNPDLTGLVRQGLIIRHGDGDRGSIYEITKAGLAACPYRNPLAAPVPPASTGAHP